MADALTAIPAASQAFMQANPGATVAQQVAAGVVKQAGNTSVPNVGTNLPSPTTAPATGFSSTAGAAALADAQNKAAKLSPAGTLQTPFNAVQVPTSSSGNGGVVQGAAPSGSTQSSNGNYVGTDGTQYTGAPGANSGASTTTPSTVTLVNKDTGQEYTLNNPTADQISSFKSNGWDIADGTGDGTGIIPTSTDPSIAAAQAASDQAKQDVATATAKLTSFNPTNDPVLQAQLASITSLWNQREQEMTNFNNSRVASTQTLGYRNGMQYTGGLGGTFGGIITAEEQQGVQRIGDLEAQKQQALSAATTAYSNQQWDRYAKLVDVAEQSYHDQVDQLNKLQTAAATASKDAADAATKAKEDYYTQVQKPKDDILVDAAKNSATPEQIAAIKAAPDLESAVAAAGSSLQTATGELGDFLATNKYLASIGQPQMTLTEYENQVDSRKAAIAAAGRADKPATQTQITYGNYAPRLETADATILSLTPDISKIPTASFLLSQRLPSWLQGSTLQTYNQAKTNFVNAVLRQESGAAISDSERASYDAQYFPQPGDSTEVIAQKAQNRAQVVASYKTAAGPAYAPPIGAVNVSSEAAAKDRVISLGKGNPEVQGKVNMLLAKNPSMSYSDILQVLNP